MIISVVQAGMIPQSINIPLSTLKRALLQDSDDFFAQYGIPKPSKTDEYLVFYSLNHVKGQTQIEMNAWVNEWMNEWINQMHLWENSKSDEWMNE